MADYRISDAELDALRGLPHTARSVYMMGLRPYMDYGTGIVGDKRRVSYRSFQELLEVDLEFLGPKLDEKPTKDKARIAIRQLERRGLVEKLPTKNQRDPLRFCLPLAAVGSIRPEEQDHINTTSTTPQQTSVFATDVGESTPHQHHIHNTTPPEDSGNPRIDPYRDLVGDSPCGDPSDLPAKPRANGKEAKSVLSYLNQRVGSSYLHTRPDGKPTQARELVAALQRKGYGEEAFRLVIDSKAAEWMPSEKMRPYLRPETLFRASKFESYYHQALAEQEVPA